MLHARTHARTRLTALCPGLNNLDFTKARDSEWQWHQLGHMQVCTSFQTDNHASTPPLSLLQAGCPSSRPTNSVKALKAVRLCYTVNKISKSTPIYSACICLLYTISIYLPSVLWHCWLGVRKSIWPVKTEWWGDGVVVCLEQGADCLHMVQLMPLHPETPSFLASFKSGLFFAFLVPAYLGCPGKEATKRIITEGMIQKKPSVLMPSVLNAFSA